MMKKKYYVGLDVHNESVAIAYTLGGSRSQPTYFAECGGSDLAVERALRELVITRALESRPSAKAIGEDKKLWYPVHAYQHTRLRE